MVLHEVGMTEQRLLTIQVWCITREYLLTEFDCMSCHSCVSDMEFTLIFANMTCDILRALTSTNGCTS